MIQQSNKNQTGFALPTILISSVVMIIVMLAAIQSVVSVRVALNSQYNNQLVQEAAESGEIKARACLDNNGGIPEWSDASMLGPGTDCKGKAIKGVSQYLFVSSSGKIRTSFTVPFPSVDATGKATNVRASGSTELIRSSNGLPWKSFVSNASNASSTIIQPYVDDSMPLGTSLAGYWSEPPPGYLFEDGSTILVNDYPDLFGLIACTYGCNFPSGGPNTFNLPDSRGYATVNKSADAEFATTGQKSGEKAHVLSINEMPYHNHAQNVCANASGTPGYRRDHKADVPSAAAYAQGVTTQSTGGSAAHNEVQPSIVKLSAIKYSKSDPAISKVPAGVSISGYWNNAPTGYLAEDGAAVSRTVNADLFAVFGTTYGAGNGSTTFNVPDSRGRLAVNRSTTDAEFAASGQKVGTKTEVLSIAQMPSHAHYQVVTANNGSPGIRRDFLSDNPCNSYAQGINTDAVGGGAAHNNIQPSIVKLSVVKQSAPYDPDSTATVMIGTSVNNWGPSVPVGYLPEDGAAVSRSTYAALFSVIGTTYGAGNGSTTFNVPDSRGRTTINRSSDVDFNTIGKKYGSKTHTVTIDELPSHAHGQYVAHNNAGGSAIRIDYGSDGGSGIYAQGIVTGYNGGSGAHNNIQPSITVQSLIKF